MLRLAAIVEQEAAAQESVKEQERKCRQRAEEKVHTYIGYFDI